ncbi:MAG: M24 family metallopeptidase [Bryobacteraceae bacterium]
MLTIQGCRARQQRLLRVMEQNRWDLFLTANYRTVYYLSGLLGPAEVPAVFAMESGGRSFVISSVTGDAAADETIALETYSTARVIDNLPADAARLLQDALGRFSGIGTCAADEGRLPLAFAGAVASVRIEDAHAAILRLRKKKEEDEIDEIRRSLRLNAVAYRTAREAIEPGLTEIDVYNAMYAALCREAGTSVSFPGDFACGERCVRGGGPPTRRRVERGDLYILDLFPVTAIYAGDTCRTIAVGQPTDLQLKAWERVHGALKLAESKVKPGLAARALYLEAKAYLDEPEWGEKSFWHHLGHGIGHDGHEAPRLIPGSDEAFEVGDVFTLEPGLYSMAMRGGIRLEDNYVVRENGIENLFEGVPLEL